MNSVSLVGNLTRDPAFFAQKDADFVAKFDIATEVGYDPETKKQRVEYVPITAFGISESFKKHLTKGRKISVTGRVGTDSFEKGGETVYQCTVKAFNGAVRLIDAPKETEVTS